MTVAMEPTIWENSTSVTKKSSDKGKNHTQIQRRNAAAITKGIKAITKRDGTGLCYKKFTR